MAQLAACAVLGRGQRRNEGLSTSTRLDGSKWTRHNGPEREEEGLSTLDEDDTRGSAAL